jgi:hypothetical protein
LNGSRKIAGSAHSGVAMATALTLGSASCRCSHYTSHVGERVGEWRSLHYEAPQSPWANRGRSSFVSPEVETTEASQAKKSEESNAILMENWEQELLDGGWKRERTTLWRSPHGDLYRGPYKAWQVMKSIEQWGLKRCSDCRAVASRGGKVEHEKACTKGDLAVEILVEGIIV